MDHAAVDLPFAMFGDSTHRAAEVALLLGDRAIFSTDRKLERDVEQLDLAAQVLAASAEGGPGPIG